MRLSSLCFFCLVLCLLVACTSSPQTQIHNKVETSKTVDELIFRIATGSCDDQDKPQDFWDEIAKKNPQLWLWLGDNIYGDAKSARELEKKYKKLLGNPSYKALRSQLRVTGTWDDHDYGANDAGADYSLKEKSKELFWDFMQIPRGHVLRYQNGIYRSEEWSMGNVEYPKKVKLIILDSRYNRDPVKKNEAKEYVPTEGDMLGEEQWAWFESEVSESAGYDALLVVNGTQVLSDKHAYEKWANFPKSRERLLKVLEASTAKIKLLLSGDRHFAEFSQMTFPNGTKLTEFTASGLTHSYESVKEENSFRVGSLWPKTHFGLIDFYENEKALKVKLSIVDITTQEDVGILELKGTP